MTIPENIVRNPQRQSAIREFKARVREETPDSPSRWLPTPPPTSSPVKKNSKPSPSSCSLVTIINPENRNFIVVNSFLYFDHSIKYV